MENFEVRFTVFRSKNDPSRIYISYQPVLRRDWVTAIDFDSVGTLKNALLSVPSTVRPKLPWQWDSVIERCLEYEPEKRFQFATEVASALRARPTHLKR
jgi:hypothetical protein